MVALHSPQRRGQKQLVHPGEHSGLGAMQSVDRGDVSTKAYVNKEPPKPVQGNSVLQRSKARVNLPVTRVVFVR